MKSIRLTTYNVSYNLKGTMEWSGRLEKALSTIQPTSVEAERAFSVAGRFLTKLRTRMLDSTLDGLVFLNHAFKATKAIRIQE